MVNFNKLDKLLKENGLSSSYLSEQMGFSRGWLKDKKLKNADIDHDHLDYIARRLGTSIEYLTDKTNEKHSESKDYIFTNRALKFATIYDALSDSQKMILDLMLEEFSQHG